MFKYMKLGSLFNQKQVDQFLREDSSRRVLTDSQVKGLQLERLSRNRGVWRIRYLSPRGRKRACMTLGPASTLSLTKARELAQKNFLELVNGEDPKHQRQVLKSVQTFREFVVERYMPYVRGYKKAANSDDSYLRNQILPVLGHKYLDEITKKDIIDFHHGLRAKGYKPGTCNRSLILLRYAFNLAIKWEIPGVKTNPTKDVPLLNDEEGKKERYLSKEETERLFEVLKRSDNPLLQFIIPMLILTGARKREVLDARWEDFDLVKRQWRIPITKAGRPRYVPLSSGVINLLAHVPHDDHNPWVFPNPKTGKPYISIFGSWNTARQAAGLGEVRIHDLRHSFASFLVNAGRSLYEVQRILGHTQIKTTQRYAHLSHDTLIDAVNVASEHLMPLITPDVPMTNPQHLGYRHV